MEIAEIYKLILEGLEMPISYLLNPSKRLFYFYLVSSLILAYYVYYQSKIQYSFLKYLFHKKVWASKSAFVDYGLVFFNGIIKVFLIAPFLVFGLYISIYVNDFLVDIFNYPSFSLSQTQTLILFTISITVITDFATYIIHLGMHKLPILWEFHKVHHSATTLNPITQYRIHPIELIINNIKGILVFGVTTGIFDYLSDHQVHKMMFFGANAFSFIFMFWGANLRHSHVKLKYFNFLEYVFISPFQHQIHHSNKPEHYDRNLGAKLALWDWMFGTLVLSKSVREIRFGLVEKDEKQLNSFLKNLWYPFLGVIRIFFPRKN